MSKQAGPISNLLLLVVLCGGLLPACSSPQEAEQSHNLEDGLLLQISSHVRLSGEVDLSSYVLPHLPLSKLAITRSSLAPATTTELDILVDLYSAYLSRLQSQGNLSDSNIDRTVDQLDAKIKDLNWRSQRLERRRRRRRRGFAGFFRRVGRGIGRFVRQLGRGIGKAAEYLIEEVAPEVIRNMVLTGQPLTAKVFWSGVRKVMRNRLKTAIGNQLARRGVPVVLLEKAGLDFDGSSTVDGEAEEAKPLVEVGYGDHTLLVNEDKKREGYLEWYEYWTNLPDDGIDDCQPTGEPSLDVTAYLEGFQMTLDFELDSSQLKGSFSGEGIFDITYEVTDWAYGGTIEGGWVRPNADGRGWSFGGTAVFDISIYDQLRCFHCNPVQGGCDFVEQWIEDEQAKQIRGVLQGWTEQLVAGEGDDPDRLEPGGVYTLSVDYEGPDAALQFECIDCLLPADFPPPVYLEE